MTPCSFPWHGVKTVVLFLQIGFVDGNKRIGTHAMLVTLDINGIELQYQDEDLIQLILKIASGKADDRVLRTWVLAHIA